MTDEPVDLSVLYRESRLRIADLVSSAASLDDVRVPTCPAWSAHQLLAHLVGVVEDFADHKVPPHGPTPEWTATQVARREDLSVPEILAAWDDAAARWEPELVGQRFSASVMDVAAHEHDLRTALGEPGGRQDATLAWAAAALLRVLDPPVPIVVHTEDGSVRTGPAEGTPLELETSRFELFRWRLGRRSRAQLGAMAWSADPHEVLDHLVIMGPADHDISE
ncbi:MAG TPA: maleylpyruvate isomerase family mycothiol-dependent enzyme [Acidimicrobiales bacterium]